MNYGGSVPEEIVELSIDNYNGHDPGAVMEESLSLQPDGTYEVPFNNTAIYSPLSYLPQLCGFALGSLLGLSAAAQYYLAELVTLLAWSILAGLAVWLLPRHRVAYLILILCPLMWFPYSFAISADSLLLAEMLLFVALVYRVLLVGSTTSTIALASLLGFLIAVSKPSYLLFPMLLIAALLLRKDRKRIWIPLVALFAAAAFDFAWLKANSGIATSPTMVSTGLIAERTADISSLAFQALTHLAYSVTHLQGSYVIGPESVLVFWLALCVSLILMVVCMLRMRLSSKAGDLGSASIASEKTALIFWACGWLVVLASALLMYAALWLQYTPADVPGIIGIQYRYFLPFLPIGVLLVMDLGDIIRRTSQ